MNQVKIRVLSGGIKGYSVGQEVRVDADDEGTPLDLGWQRRLRDAKRDGCCEIVAPKRSKNETRRRRIQTIPFEVEDGPQE